MAQTNPDDRRQRLFDAAVGLVARGGYDALQVRALTERTGISSRTVYALFPSKEYLLISALADQAASVQADFLAHPPPGSTARERVRRLVDRLSDAMTANPQVTAALFRCLLCGKPEVTELLDRFGETMKSMLLVAMAPEIPSPRDGVIADILDSVWFSAIVGWVSGLQEASYVPESVDRAASLLLPAPR